MIDFKIEKDFVNLINNFDRVLVQSLANDIKIAKFLIQLNFTLISGEHFQLYSNDGIQ